MEGTERGSNGKNAPLGICRRLQMPTKHNHPVSSLATSSPVFNKTAPCVDTFHHHLVFNKQPLLVPGLVGPWPQLLRLVTFDVTLFKAWAAIVVGPSSTARRAAVVPTARLPKYVVWLVVS